MRRMSGRGTLPRACLEAAWYNGIAAGGKRRWRQPESSAAAAPMVAVVAVVAAVASTSGSLTLRPPRASGQSRAY